MVRKGNGGKEKNTLYKGRYRGRRETREKLEAEKKRRNSSSLKSAGPSSAVEHGFIFWNCSQKTRGKDERKTW